MQSRIFLLLITIVPLSLSAQQKSIILDSDIGPYFDDVGAITMLHAAEDQGKIKLLATMASNQYESAAAVLQVFNTYWGRPDLPIGVVRGKAVSQQESDISQHWTDSLLAHYPHSIDSNREAFDATKLYRMILSLQPDSSVTILCIGFLTNLANLLQSKADDISPLSGKELVKKKVKQLISMAGEFPSGREFNIYNDASTAKLVFENWPGTVIFSGFKVGKNIFTGKALVAGEQKGNPAKEAFEIAFRNPGNSEGQMSFDQSATLVAINGAAPFFDLIPGNIVIHEKDGSNQWDENGKGQFYLKIKESPTEMIAGAIDQMMIAEPKGKERNH